jgi:hypothetical protein
MKKILLIYVSRSFSTLFMRIMMNANARVYHDRMGAAIRFPREGMTPRTVTDFYIAKSQANTENSAHTFVKESCWVFEQNEGCLRELIREHGFRPIFLVRHPRDALLSYLEVERRVGDEKWSTGRSIRHDLLHLFFEEYGGHLVIGEDFVSDPETVMREVFEYLDVPFDESILQLRALDIDTLEESDILKHYDRFYEAALKSDRIIDKTMSRKEVEITDPELLESIERNLHYYKLLVAEKQRRRASRALQIRG